MRVLIKCSIDYIYSVYYNVYNNQKEKKHL